MAISSTGSTPALSSPGIGSGLDVAGLVAKLMAVEQAPMTALEKKETAYKSTISAFGTVKGAVSAFQGALKRLSDPSAFKAYAATLGDASVLTTTAGAGAVPGSYAIEVSQLAQAQKIASAGFADATDAVGSGKLTFTFGTFDAGVFTANGSATKSVTIAPGQQTLTGIRDAVNAAGVGVTASIVNDGSANGNRLVFTSNSSGAANSLKIDATDDDLNNVDALGLSQLAYDPAALAGAGKNMTEKVAAQNALLTIDGISVSKASNTITDAVQGVTLNLLKKNVGAPTTLTVSQDNKAITDAVQAFVSSYNSMHNTLDSLTKYDAATKTASVLTGDSTVRLLESQLRATLGSSVAGMPTSFNTLSAIGISYQADGTLALNTAKLSSALASNASDVARMFAAVGQPTDSLVSVAATTAKTKQGTYDVNVTTLATRGSLAGQSAAGLTITAGVNDQLSVTVDGVSSTVTLAAGTYASADALAAELQSKINGATAIGAASSSVTVRQTGGVLTIQSSRYGSASNVNVSGIGASSLLGATPAATAGVDVAGTIGGVAALGSGQVLTAATGIASEGLQLKIAGGATGARGSVTYTQGYASLLDRVLAPILDTSGILAARTNGLNDSVKRLDDQKEQLQARIDAIQKRYTAQFSALDGMLASLQQTSSYLTQQLANLPTPGKSSS